MPLVLDLRISQDRFGRSSDFSLNGNLRYPNDIDRSLNEDATDKIRKYRTDYNNNPPTSVSFMTVITSTSGRLHSEFIRLLFLQAHRETAFLQLHEFSLRNRPVETSSISSVWRSSHSCVRKSAAPSPRLQFYVLT